MDAAFMSFQRTAARHGPDGGGPQVLAPDARALPARSC